MCILTNFDCSLTAKGQSKNNEFVNLRMEAETLGKPEWHDMLIYLAELHEKGTHPAQPPFPFDWEEIGIGYQSRAFGHWDIVHIVLDVLPVMPIHSKQQLLNNLANQEEDGLVPGSIWLEEIDSKMIPKWNKMAGHPPLWPIAVQMYFNQTRDTSIIKQCFEPLIRQIGWFEANRKAKPSGYWYSRTTWESGLDDDLRYLTVTPGSNNPLPCIDATCHVFAMYKFAADWAKLLRKNPSVYLSKANRLMKFIQNELYDKESDYFYDFWSVNKKDRVLSFAGMWPVVLGAASNSQAKSVIGKYLLNPDKFFTKHPITSIGVKDPQFELLTWHGPAWNSMTYWAALGCIRYGYTVAAQQLLERALDNSATQFKRTGTIWEFYDPFGGKPEDVRREVKPPYRHPNRDYAGHNPLLAMARLYDKLK